MIATNSILRAFVTLSRSVSASQPARHVGHRTGPATFARKFSTFRPTRRATPLSATVVPTLDSSSPSQPTFPTNVPTHPLIIVDYEHIRAGDSTEIDQLWKAATTLGFWYLKNHGTTAEVDNMFAMGEDVMRLPIEEKMKYEQGDTGNSFGYKHAGANATNAAGAPDTIEFLNIAQDHALAAPHPPAHRYPPCVPFPLVTAFVRRAAEVNLTLMRALGARLGLSRAFEARHALGAPSGSEVRFTRNAVPRGPGEAMRKGIGAHTDFGSLSFVHNRLGGLQVLPPGSDEWQYVKPLPDHAVCNIGDALSILSGGILRSNLHRVVPPPPPQNHLPRTSLVFLTRPARDVVLRALTEESALVRDAVEERQARGEDVTPYFGTSTAGEWFERRIRGWRIRNREGPQTWIASRGTEGRDEGDIPDETRAGEAVK